jgi:hypothetical protein
VAIQCMLLAGVGTNMLTLLVANQSATFSFDYDRPVLAVASRVGGGTLLSTTASETLTFTGNNFGPAGTAIGVQYRVATNSAANRVSLTDCNLTIPHTAIQCASVADIGAGALQFLVTAAGNAGVEFSSTLSYAAPTISSLTPANFPLDTRGNETVAVTGNHFGPFGAVSVSGSGLTRTAEYGVSVAGMSFRYNVSCTVTVAGTHMVCTTDAGVGGVTTWKVNVGGQVTESTHTTRYKTPVIGSTNTPNTNGQETITISGDYFGPTGTPQVLFTFTAISWSGQCVEQSVTERESESERERERERERESVCVFMYI